MVYSAYLFIYFFETFYYDKYVCTSSRVNIKPFYKFELQISRRSHAHCVRQILSFRILHEPVRLKRS